MAHIRHNKTHNAFVPRSRSYQSPFGRLFPKLEPWRSPESSEAAAIAALQEFANTAMSEPAGTSIFDNANLPAGYTYFGQFVDHDITFDPTSSLQRQNDPNKLHNFRTPRLDLDCVYGSGPSDQPYLYDSKQKGMLLTHHVVVDSTTGPPEVMFEPDLARNHQGRALIGDMRNDENLIVSQIQLAMIILHNRVYAKVMGVDDLDDLEEEFELDMAAFTEAQRIVRWFYQYIVWNDFIKRLIPDAIFSRLLKKEPDSELRSYGGRFYNWKKDTFMPVEFSVAAYRFGHSLVRPGYQINSIIGFGVEKPIFNPDGSGSGDLSGFKDREALHTLQWDWYLQFPSSGAPFFPQPSRKIDARLSESVFKVPEGPEQPNLLSFLNLLRSFRMDLPTGTAVAHAMGLPAHDIDDPHEDILFHYVLKESELLPAIVRGQQLGPVGGTIVGEVFAGLLAGDSMSYINCFPAWDPSLEAVLPFAEPLRPEDGWELADLIRAAGMPVDSDNVDDFVSNGIPGVPYGL